LDERKRLLGQSWRDSALWGKRFLVHQQLQKVTRFRRGLPYSWPRTWPRSLGSWIVRDISGDDKPGVKEGLPRSTASLVPRAAHNRPKLIPAERASTVLRTSAGAVSFVQSTGIATTRVGINRGSGDRQGLDCRRSQSGRNRSRIERELTPTVVRRGRRNVRENAEKARFLQREATSVKTVGITKYNCPSGPVATTRSFDGTCCSTSSGGG
jgi:hypothetical protein